MNHEERILEILGQIQQDISELKTGQAVVEGRLRHLEHGQTHLTIATESLDRKQTALEGRLERLEKGQAKLEAGQAKLEAGQAKLEAGQAKLEAGQAKLEAGQAIIKKDIEEIKTNIKFMWEDIDNISDRLGVQEEIVHKKLI